MFKSIILSLVALTGVSRAVTTDVVHATHNTQANYYYYSNSYSSFNADIINGTFTYVLNRSNTFINGNSTDLEDEPFFGNDTDYLVGNGVYFAYSSGDTFDISTTYDDSNYHMNQTIEDLNTDYSFLYLTNDFNYDDSYDSAYVSQNSSYLLSGRLFGNNDYYVVNYVVCYASSYNEYIDNLNYYYGSISIDPNNNLVNIPYFNTTTPNFVDDDYLTITLTISSSGSYQSGYNTGYSQGNSTGFENGYNSGYNVGFENGANSGNSFIRLLFAIADTPIYYLRSLFNVSIFGFNVAAVVLGLLTSLIIIWVVKRFI